MPWKNDTRENIGRIDGKQILRKFINKFFYCDTLNYVKKLILKCQKTPFKFLVHFLFIDNFETVEKLNENGVFNIFIDRFSKKYVCNFVPFFKSSIYTNFSIAIYSEELSTKYLNMFPL